MLLLSSIGYIIGQHTIKSNKKEAIHTNGFFLAESVRFELTVGFPITSFQDWLLKPLGQLSG